MHFLTRMTLTLLAAWAVLGAASSDTLASLKQHLGSIPDILRMMAEERTRSDSLDEQGARVAARSEAKRRLFAELVAGRLDLPQAATRFRALCAGAPEVRQALKSLYESGSEQERLCRFLIYCVEMELDSPTQKEAVRRRLTDELEARLRSGAPLLAP